MHRIHGIEIDIFQEGGFVAQSYIHAEERINSRPISERNEYGTFLFITDNNSAVSYSVSTKMEICPNCCRETVSDSYLLLNQLLANDCDILNEMDFNDFHDEENLFNIEKVRRQINLYLLSSEERKIEISKEFSFLIHQACRLGMSKEYVAQLLSSTDDFKLSQKKNLLRKDKNGWTPLHHACRYQPENQSNLMIKKELIKFLVEIAPEAVSVPDNVYRYPLHIAVDSQAVVLIPDDVSGLEHVCPYSQVSEEIVHFLLDAAVQKAPLTERTKYLELTPLHIALNRGASEGVIKLLLESDSKKSNVRTKSKVQCLPLHVGLEKKATFSVVDMLLLHYQAAIESKDAKDIYEKVDGRYPRKFLYCRIILFLEKF